MSFRFLIPVWGASCILSSSAPAVTWYGPPTVNYRHYTDSPFIRGIDDGTIYLEDFEDHLLNSPFVTAFNELGGPPSVSSDTPSLALTGIHSVDSDDGVFDGLGANGDALVTGNSLPYRFIFSRDSQGRLPLYAGFVVTEVERTVRDFVLDVYGPDGTMLGRQTWLAGQDGDIDQLNGIPSDSRNEVPLFPPGLAYGDTFVGVHAAEGISELRFGRAYQIDHLQYGYAIPEPRTLVTGGIALLLILRTRKRARAVPA